PLPPTHPDEGEPRVQAPSTRLEFLLQRDARDERRSERDGDHHPHSHHRGDRTSLGSPVGPVRGPVLGHRRCPCLHLSRDILRRLAHLPYDVSARDAPTTLSTLLRRDRT